MADTRLEFTVGISGQDHTILLEPADALARYGLASNTGVAQATATAGRKVIPVTATAGAPGSVKPHDLGTLAAVTPSPATAWTVGQSIVLGDTTHAYWDGVKWVTGTAPSA